MKRRRINKKKVALVIFTFIIIILVIAYLVSNIITLINTPDEVKIEKVSSKDPITLLNYYLPSNKERYKDYKKKHPDLSDEDIVTYVNMSLDHNFYEHIIIQPNSKLNTIVNKYYRLDNNFVPDDLVYINDGYTDSNDPAYKYRKHQMSREVYDDFVALRNKCREKGISFYVVSGYRSTPAQEKSYRHMANTFSVEEADKTCSRPGHSEHTLGLACDVALDTYSFENIVTHPEYKWFAEILVDYGFIVRYPEGKDSLTGYSYEPWHLRYLGKDLAKKVYNSNLTYDEYYARNFTQ
ncbi:putative carboxypeptidase YodJ [Thomasclavelia cocleata]|uniref:Putative carboxypeptidase YodJ n=1 Tax=Thomasclavelia cocleata TaxID=69824 RepID=A0A829ZC25_9FIRM|nr:M15 family metallopeptidase [Thomasclavelia cocleata]GFI41465.1 putative carboxypeptidase YodJ [Thomasclavelia cocleata]